ncbi:MAG: sialate O-acetylesterase, partial [Planctomycetota bacterium]|nr:sialate O-acetylesterase [Planctomycetota bacterium]
EQLSSKELPVVIGQTGNMNSPALHAAQRAGATAAGRDGPAGFVETEAFLRKPEDSPNTTHGHHWFGNAESYLLIGDALGESMVELLPKPR